MYKLVCGQMCYITVIKVDLSLLRTVISCKTVEETGLPRAVRSYHSQQFTCFHTQVDLAQGHDAAKAQGKIYYI